jgi:hypothetical protein
MPDDDFNHTHTDELFWLCGDILDRAWRYLEEKEETQKKYRDMMYELYWPRVGSLWPVINREKIEFKHYSAAKIFDDSFSFVMSLEDIDERNGEIRFILENHATDIGYNTGPLGRRAFVYTLKDLKPKDEFEKILTTIEPEHLDSFLSYPDDIESAKILLEELFRTDTNARITGRARLATFEALLIRPNTIGVGEYILNYLDKHFEDFTKIISTEVINLGYPDSLPVLADYFIAISKGITEENEFQAVRSIQKKLEKLGCDKEILNNAATYARHHRRTILFQRSALQNIF